MTNFKISLPPPFVDVVDVGIVVVGFDVVTVVIGPVVDTSPLVDIDPVVDTSIDAVCPVPY